jgi:hypothetical protein
MLYSFVVLRNAFRMGKDGASAEFFGKCLRFQKLVVVTMADLTLMDLASGTPRPAILSGHLLDGDVVAAGDKRMAIALFWQLATIPQLGN